MNQAKLIIFRWTHCMLMLGVFTIGQSQVCTTFGQDDSPRAESLKITGGKFDDEQAVTLVSAMQDLLDTDPTAAYEIGKKLLAPGAVKEKYQLQAHQLSGHARLNQMKIASSRKHFELALSLARKLENQTEIIQALSNLAIIDFYKGNFDDAKKVCKEAFLISQEIGRKDYVLKVGNTLASICLRQGDFAKAIDMYTEIERLVDADTLASSQGVLQNNKGVANMYIGNYEIAMKMFRDAEVTHRRQGNKVGVASAIANQGDALHLQKKYADALEKQKKAFEIRTEIKDAHGLAKSGYSIGLTQFELENYSESLKAFEQAVSIQRSLMIPSDLSATLAGMAKTLVHLDRDKEAMTAAEQSVKVAEQLKVKGRLVENLLALAYVQRQTGKFEEALKNIDRSRELETSLLRNDEKRRYADLVQDQTIRDQLQTIDSNREALEEKNQAIEELEQSQLIGDLRLQNQRLQQNLLAGGSVLLLLFAVVGWVLVVAKRKTNRAMAKEHEYDRKMLEAKRLESLGALAGGVAHDFNNLLVGVFCNVQLVRNELGEDDKRVAEFLDGIEAAADQATCITQRMLDFTGRRNMRTVDVDVRAVIEESVRLLDSSVAAASSVRSQFKTSNAFVVGDPTQLRQVFMNLISNAIEACEEKDSCQIEIDVENVEIAQADVAEWLNGEEVSSGPFVQITVSDNGKGVSVDDQPRMFDPFFTTKFSGRGMGLATVYGIVVAHRGAIQVESRIGKGTTFRILIPESKVKAETASDPADSECLESDSSQSFKILLIDDDRNVRQSTGRLLQRKGFEILMAPDGETGLDLLKREPEVAVVMLDITMPGIGGLETLERIRRDHADLPVILMSGYSEESSGSQYLRDDCCSFLNKPFGIGELDEKLAAAIA